MLGCGCDDGWISLLDIFGKRYLTPTPLMMTFFQFRTACPATNRPCKPLMLLLSFAWGNANHSSFFSSSLLSCSPCFPLLSSRFFCDTKHESPGKRTTYDALCCCVCGQSNLIPCFRCLQILFMGLLGGVLGGLLLTFPGLFREYMGKKD